MTDPATFRYRAFLSYSHKDAAWGIWLHQALERYHIDRDLVGRDTPVGKIPPNLRPIFVDRYDFAGGYSLRDATINAIGAAECLIVICSPAAAASAYVNEEIRLFKATGRSARIIPIIVDGEPGDTKAECFPDALKFEIGLGGQVTTTPANPIAADARDQADGREIAKQKVVAGLLGIGLDEIRKRAARAQRRRFIALSSVTAVMAVLALVAVIAAWTARSRTIEAEQRLNWALETAGGITSKAATFKNKFGVPAPVLADLLQEVERLLNRLALQGVKSSDLVLREAALLGALSDGNQSIGNTANALANAKQASEKFEQLTKERSTSLDLKSSLAHSYLRTGYILSLQNSNKDAHLKFVAAESIFRSLVATEPNSPGWKDGLAASLDLLAGSFALQGDAQREKASIDEEIVIRRGLNAAYPNNTFYRSTLANALNHGGMKALQSDDPVVAQTLLKEALAINLSLAQTDPTNSKWADNLATNQLNLGYCLERLGDTSGGINYFSAARETLRKLSDSDPSDVTKMGNYAFGTQRLAATYSMAGRTADAAQMFDDVVATRRKILSIDRFDASQKMNLTLSLTQLAKSRWDAGDSAGALSNGEEASQLASDLVRSDPNNTEAKRNRIAALGFISIVKDARGDGSGSLSSAEEGAKLSAEVAAQDPQSQSKASTAFFARVLLAAKYRQQGRTADSIKALDEITSFAERPEVADDPLWFSFRSHLYEQKYMTYWDMNQMDDSMAAAVLCLGVAKRWVETDIGSTLAKQRLALAFTIVGIAARRMKRLDDAKEALSSGLALRKSLVESDPRDLPLRGDLAVSWSQLNSLLMDQGDYPGALVAEQNALSIRRELVETDSSNLETKKSLAESYSGVGATLELLDRKTEAREAFELALKTRQSLADSQPGAEDIKNDIKWTLKRLSDLPPVIEGPALVPAGKSN
jgi:tetratricopeptide (TPR) repeat protein